jgi:hypothetical protein
MTQDEINRRVQEYRQNALQHFPLELIETTGDQALAKWQELKSAGQGFPVVLGADDDSNSFVDLLTPFGPNGPHVPPPRPVEEILGAAAGIRFPDHLAKPRKHDPPLGEWPQSPDPSMGLSVARNILTGKPLPKVYIGLAPTDDWTTIPAYLRWGDWNACPAAEYHVAAMRTWRNRYDAELIGMSFDTINLRVATRPKTPDEALALARDQYVYCADVIDQGVRTCSALAAHLMVSDWWYFWWD